MGDLSESDRQTLVGGVLNFEGKPEKVFSIEMCQPYGLSLVVIAERLGRNPSTVRKRAKKMGIYMERIWLRSKQGTMQETWITNNEGAAALKAWFGE